MMWLKLKIRKWLGIEQNSKKIDKTDKFLNDIISIGVDVHFKEPHMILIYSKLKGGQIRHIPIMLDNLKELVDLVQELKARYKTRIETWDMPYKSMRDSHLIQKFI